MKGPGQDLYTPITNSNNAKDVTVCVGLVISGRLDSEKLLRGAFDLVAKWPLLGGSIVQNTSPWSFATGNKVDFRSRTVDKAVHEIFGVPFWEKSPAGLSYIHQATDSRAVDKLFHFDNYRAYDARIDGMVSIRATTLEDATLLGFRCSHYLVNAATLCEIIQAYCDILADRPIPELVWPPDSQPNQPLSDLVAIDGRDSKARHDPIPEDNLVTWADFNRIGAWAALPMLWTTIVTVLLSWLLKSYALEERFMYIPAITVEKMRAEEQRKVQGFARLSRLDVISAWFLKTTFASSPSDSDVFACSYPIGYRSSLPPVGPGSHWLKNTTYEIFIRWERFSEFKASNLADIAARIRLKVLACKDPTAIKSSLQSLEKWNASFVTPGMSGKNRFDRFPIVSSWGDGFYNFDFSCVVEQLKHSIIPPQAGRVVFAVPRNLYPGGFIFNGACFVLRDETGGFWLRATLGRKEWEGHDKLESSMVN